MDAPTATILAIEDEPLNAALLRAILTPAGYELHIEPTLADARDWLSMSTPDLLLLDRHLPDGDGLELVPEVRASKETRDCKILMLTASVLPEDRASAELAGCDGFMAKPLRVAALLEEIRRLLGS
jgi:DNA-binding response OmpR family regulator